MTSSLAPSIFVIGMAPYFPQFSVRGTSAVELRGRIKESEFVGKVRWPTNASRCGAHAFMVKIRLDELTQWFLENPEAELEMVRRCLSHGPRELRHIEMHAVKLVRPEVENTCYQVSMGLFMAFDCDHEYTYECPKSCFYA